MKDPGHDLRADTGSFSPPDVVGTFASSIPPTLAVFLYLFLIRAQLISKQAVMEIDLALNPRYHDPFKTVWLHF